LPAQPTFADPRPYLRAAGRLRGVHGWPASPVGGPRRTWLVSVAVAFLFVVSTVVSALFPSASMVWPGSQSLSGGVAVSAAVSVHNRGSSDYSEYRVSAGHSHGPPTVVNVQFCHDQTYYVLAGDTPVLVHNDGGAVPGPTFVNGELFEWTMRTPQGNVTMLAEVRINGTNLTLGDIVVYGDTPELQRGALNPSTVLSELRGKIAPAAAAQGFTNLQITGTRLTGPVGHPVNINLDLSGYC
jgi:hypothetical protein